MPNLAELVVSQRRFEKDRNLYESRDIGFLIDRSQDEWHEFLAEIESGDLYRALQEILDYINILMSLVCHIIDDIGILPEQVDTMMDRISDLRDKKYQINLFMTLPPEEAIRVSRDQWSMSQGEK